MGIRLSLPIIGCTAKKVGCMRRGEGRPFQKNDFNHGLDTDEVWFRVQSVVHPWLKT
jgi:hypothetical protein